MKWRLMRKRARGQQNIGDYCQCVLESKVAIFIHVLESCTGDIYWWDIGGYLLVRYWRVAEEYCVFLVLPICRTDVVSPSKVPKTKQNTPVEDASLPAPRTAWHLKCRLYWICVACNGGAIFFYFHLLAFSWVHQGQCYLPGTEACWAQGPPKAMAFKCVKFSSDCYWRVFGGRQLSILFAKHQVWKQHCSWLHEIPRGCSKDCSGSLLNIYLWSLAPDGKKIQLRLLVAGLGNPSMRRPGASGRPRSAPRKTHGSQRVGPNKKLMIGMQRKEKKTNRKKQVQGEEGWRDGAQPNGLTWPCWAMDSCDTGVTGDMKTALCLQSQCHVWHDVIWACWWCFFCVVCSAVFPLCDC